VHGNAQANEKLIMLMKNWIPLLALALTMGFLTTACSKARQVETDNLSQSFATAAPELKTEVQRAVAAIRTRDFNTALVSLRTLAQTPNLTEDQRQAVEDSTTDITVIIAENPPENADDLYDLVDDIQDALMATP
jgi:hypothetical protein